MQQKKHFCPTWALPLLTKMRLDWNCLPGTNTLIYSSQTQIPWVKSFITVTPGLIIVCNFGIFWQDPSAMSQRQDLSCKYHKTFYSFNYHVIFHFLFQDSIFHLIQGFRTRIHSVKELHLLAPKLLELIQLWNGSSHSISLSWFLIWIGSLSILFKNMHDEK
jgi:hypothetical protein